MKLGNWFAFSIVAMMLLTIHVSASADTAEATISLGREPEPPYCVQTPGGVLDISWDIEHETTPAYVLYQMWDPSQTTILEEETYPGDTGLTINRQWVAAAGLEDGKYWIRIEYWSEEAANEANAEVTFYVCGGELSDICAIKYNDLNCNGELDDTDPPLEGWWICLETSEGDTFCQQTGADGVVCWEDIPVGDYTVYEQLQDGWTAIYPESVDVVLVGGQSVDVVFFNSNCPSPVEDASWGTLKGLYR